MHTYTFDVKSFLTVRVTSSEGQAVAQKMLEDALREADMGPVLLAYGVVLSCIGEGDDDGPDLVEIDGEAV